MNEKTAIVMFVYNRPKHTLKVLEGLKGNNITNLTVFSDGPRKSEDISGVTEVRKIVDSIKWCNVSKIYRDGNIGLSESVIQGVNYIFDKGYERVVVLEDDCIPNNNFINFMEKAFDKYEHNDEVFHISGFGLPIKKHTKSDNFLSPYPCSWGWGTWKKYWKKCDFYQNENYKSLLEDRKKVESFNYPGEAFSEFLEMQLHGKINSWLIRWYYFIYQNSGKCVWSYDSFIKNYGFDGTGVHTNRFDRFNQRNPKEIELCSYQFEANNEINPKLIREFRRHFMGKSKKERLKTAIYLATGMIIGK